MEYKRSYRLDLQYLPAVEHFYRVNNPSLQQISGLGIGLYISAEIVKRHSGSIWVESEPGEGSDFHFTLPLTSQETDISIN